MNPMEAAAVKKQQERETLRNVIAQWNANRLDLFELSEPNEVSLVELHVRHEARLLFALSSTGTAVKSADDIHILVIGRSRNCDLSRT
jgi:hypothetical protein